MIPRTRSTEGLTEEMVPFNQAGIGPEISGRHPQYRLDRIADERERALRLGPQNEEDVTRGLAALSKPAIGRRLFRAIVSG